MISTSIPENNVQSRRFFRSAAMTFLAAQLGLAGCEKVVAVPRLPIEGEMPPSTVPANG
jgi:hypothetical protein